MNSMTDNFIAEFEVNLELVENASPIEMELVYTIEDNQQFTDTISILREKDTERARINGGRSRFNSHQAFIEHILCFIMKVNRSQYFSIRTRNEPNSKYSYRSINYAIDLLDYCGWIRRLPKGVVKRSVGASVPQPWSRIEVLDDFPILEGDYKITILNEDVDYVTTDYVTWNDSSGVYIDGSYSKDDYLEDNKLLKEYNLLMMETDIRDNEGNQVHWLNPLKRRVTLKDFPYRNKRIQGITGGRFWGPKFQNKNDEYRLSHTFNGNPLVEVDVNRCYTQFAFHMNDIPVPDLRNFYDIPVEIMNDPEVDKKKIKSIFNRVYFVSGERYWKQSLYKSHRIKPYQADLLLPRYDPIRNLIFNKSIGHQLMWMESQLVRHVLEKAVKGSVPVIPIHDSYLVPLEKEGWVKGCINIAYHQYREPFVSRREAIGDEEWFHYQVQTTSDYTV